MASPPIKLRVLPLLLFLLHLPFISSSAPTSYSTHCPTSESSPDVSSGGPIRRDPLPSFAISLARFSGADSLFDRTTNTLSFRPNLVRRTISPDTLHVTGILTLPGSHPNFPLSHGHNASITVRVDGYWSYSTSKLCMVGDALGIVQGIQTRFPAVFNANFPTKFNLTTSFLTGTLKNTDDSNHSGGGGFRSVSFVKYAEGGEYEYTRIHAAEEICPSVGGGRGVMRLNSSVSCADVMTMFRGGYNVRYGSGSLGLHNSYMELNQFYCDSNGGGNVRAYMALTNETKPEYGFRVGEAALVAEGFWDGESGRLCLSACKVSSSTSGGDWKVGECSLGMSFWFPAVWSLEDRSLSAGVISGRPGSEDGVVSLRSVENPRMSISGVRYNYTKIGDARKFFDKLNIRLRKGEYPDGNTYEDFSFDFSLEQIAFGYASSVSIGSVLFEGRTLWGWQDQTPSSLTKQITEKRILNISYYMLYGSRVEGEVKKISAEGFYDVDKGFLCMVGCLVFNGTVDCQVGITVQFAILKSTSGDHVKGRISSMRENSDPLFFKPLEINSDGIYSWQAAESVWRMDLESTMVLISLTMSCAFIVLQLFHVKRKPDVLTSISLTMLVMLSLGYMIPLVLDFEALLFVSHSKQTAPFLSGGLPEVLVRVMTMVAFLLQLHLVQVTFHARSVDEKNKNGSWDAEKKSLWICLPLYLIGGLVVLIVHNSSSHRDVLKAVPVRGARISSVNHAFLEDLMAYTGMIFDVFLLPQVVFNSFSDSKSKALAH